MIIGTRGSRLAMRQADMACAAIGHIFPAEPMEVKVITTGGDRDRCTPLEAMGGYGVFTKELDQRLLSGEIDLAVNSLKDMPSVLTSGIRLVAVLPRGQVEDVLVSKVPLADLPSGAVVGTSSVRRRALLGNLRPDLQVAELRGNVTTRLNKWRRGEYQAIILAGAGLERLEEGVPRHALDPEVWVPPAGQGAIALVCRKEDQDVIKLSRLDHLPTRRCVDLERAMMAGLGASCQVPIGIWANIQEGKVELQCVLLSPDGGWIKRWRATMPFDHGPEHMDTVVAALRAEWGTSI